MNAGALITKAAFEGVIDYMRREAPVNENDTGWRFFTGEEDEEYMADNDNHMILSLIHI